MARLAGIPAEVLARAEDVLNSLVEENTPLNASAVDGLPLFNMDMPPPVTQPVRGKSRLDEAMDAILPDTMTPLEALEALYRLKALSDDD